VRALRRDLIPNGEAMLAEQFLAAAAGARNSTALDETARLLWRAHSEGCIADSDAEAVSEALQARRATFAARRAPQALSPPRPALGLPRHAKRPRSPDRQASVERRRRQAMSGAVPAKIAAEPVSSEALEETGFARTPHAKMRGSGLIRVKDGRRRVAASHDVQGRASRRSACGIQG
jgi:hypothetical protein